MARLPAGVTGNNGLVLNDGQVAFLRRLRRAVPGVPLHVTSATRTPEKQAAALVAKRNLGDDLRKLYRRNPDIADALMRAPNTTSAMAAIIRRYMNQGRYLSRHMRGDAFDLRSRNLTAAQRNQVMSAAQRMGAKAIYETKPPHIHIERIGGAASNLELAAREAAGRAGGRGRRGGAALYKKRKAIGIASASVGVILLLTFVLLRKRSQP